MSNFDLSLHSIFASIRLLAVGGLFFCTLAKAAGPNIVFIAVDDLNDWVGALGGNAQPF
jgi:hypothetical protein